MASLFHNVGNTLTLIRQLRGKSQACIARDARIGKSQLSKYENGKELPRLDSLEKVLGALDIGVCDFFYTLSLVDERASALNSSDRPGAWMLPPKEGGSLLRAETEEAFSRLLIQVLDLHRRVFEEVVLGRRSELGGNADGKMNRDQGHHEPPENQA